MSILEQLKADLIKKITSEAKTEEEAIKMINTLEVTLARLAARRENKEITIDEEAMPEIEESVRIGANINAGMARKLLSSTLATLKAQDEKKLKIFDEGTFEIDDEKIVFHSEE